MEILLSTLVMLLILGACLYQRTSLFTSLAALTVTMLALSLFLAATINITTTATG